MLEAPHVLVGIAIASKVGHPLLSIPLAFGSHFVLDMLPHWNPHLNTEMKTYGHVTKKTKLIIYGDLALSFGMTAFFCLTALPNLFHAVTIGLSAISAITPDLIEAPYFFLNKKTAFLEAWIKFQKSIQTDAEPILGIATQIIVMAASLMWIMS